MLCMSFAFVFWIWYNKETKYFAVVAP